MDKNYQKIDTLLQFILAAASLNEFPNKELGMIHLIKYVYLVDLEHAKHNKGQTYTGLNWKFHHYGPWETELYLRIEPALNAINATKKNIESNFDKDYIRWNTHEGVYEKLEKEMNLLVSGVVPKYVKKYGSDTGSLLDFVYKTKPMLMAAPSEVLDFDTVIQQRREKEEVEENQLTDRQIKKRKQAYEALKKKLCVKLDNKVKRGVNPKPRYDDVFEKGVEWFDSLAGDIEDSEGTITISKKMWHSGARYNPDE